MSRCCSFVPLRFDRVPEFTELPRHRTVCRGARRWDHLSAQGPRPRRACRTAARTGPAVEPSSSAESHPRHPSSRLRCDRDDLPWSASSVDQSQPHPLPLPSSASSQHCDFASQRPHNRSGMPHSTSPARPPPHQRALLLGLRRSQPLLALRLRKAHPVPSESCAPTRQTYPKSAWCPSRCELLCGPAYSSLLSRQESFPHAFEATGGTFRPALVPLTQHFHISAAAFIKQLSTQHFLTDGDTCSQLVIRSTFSRPPTLKSRRGSAMGYAPITFHWTTAATRVR